MTISPTPLNRFCEAIDRKGQAKLAKDIIEIEMDSTVLPEDEQDEWGEGPCILIAVAEQRLNQNEQRAAPALAGPPARVNSVR